LRFRRGTNRRAYPSCETVERDRVDGFVVFNEQARRFKNEEFFDATTKALYRDRCISLLERIE
jgi:hypothetical protein